MLESDSKNTGIDEVVRDEKEKKSGSGEEGRRAQGEGGQNGKKPVEVEHAAFM